MNDGPQGGRPNNDEVVKLLVLQDWYGLSDPELERQAADRISFRRFLGYPERIPDQTTVWQLRERLAETGRDRLLWAELQRQLDEKGLRVEVVDRWGWWTRSSGTMMVGSGTTSSSSSSLREFLRAKLWLWTMHRKPGR